MQRLYWPSMPGLLKQRLGVTKQKQLGGCYWNVHLKHPQMKQRTTGSEIFADNAILAQTRNINSGLQLFLTKFQ